MWVQLRNNQLHCNCDDSRKQTAWIVFCFRFKESKNAVNSASVHSMCARTALTDSSNDKQQLQGIAIIILRKFIRIYLHLVAWEVEDQNK